MAFPVLDLTLAPPGRMAMPVVVGGAVEGGRAASGVVNAIDMTGGGLVTVKYSQVALGNSSPARLRYWSQIAALLNSGVRSIIVPLLVDFIQPKVDGLQTAIRSPFSDGKQFSDGMRFARPSSSTVATVATGAALNAGTVSLRLGSRSLSGGEWFGVAHATKSNRAYCVTEIDAVIDNNDGTRTVTVGITPPLREAVGAGTAVNFNRPACLMRLAPGTNITAEVENFWWSTPDVSFVESFGTL